MKKVKLVDKASQMVCQVKNILRNFNLNDSKMNFMKIKAREEKLVCLVTKVCLESDLTLLDHLGILI